MNLINDTAIAGIPVNAPKKGKEGAAQYYLCLVGLYIVLVFNEFIKRPVDYLALALIIIGLPLINQNNIKLLKTVISQSLAAKMVFWGLLIMSSLFFVATLRQLPRYDGLIAFGAQYGVHIGLAVMALLVIPINIKTIDFLFNCLLFALFALVLSDIILYISDIKNNIKIGSNYSHRWFGDGYVYLMPFLLAKIMLCSNLFVKSRNQNHPTFFYFHRIILYVALLFVIVLSGGTGSRSTYLILILEILIFYALWAYAGKWSSMKMLGHFLVLAIIFKIAFGLLAPELLEGAFSRGLRIWDRVLYAWGPGILIAKEAPILGHGFGSVAWDSAYAALKLIRPEIINYGSAHNWFLAAAFFGGISALIAQVFLTVGIITLAIRYFDKLTKNLSFITNNFFILALLLSFISFYCVRGQVEFTTYKYFAVTLIAVAVSCTAPKCINNVAHITN